jgi:hypothetical protein
MNTATTIREPRARVNLFVPIVLVGGGVILLMWNFGMLTRDPFLFLMQFWPLFLIAGGIQLLFGRTGAASTWVSALLGLAVVGVAIFFFTQPGPVVVPVWWNWNFRP